jgi:hypothetical protein
MSRAQPNEGEDVSIYCSFFDLGADHSTRCKRLRKIRHKVYEQDDSKPCTCGSSPIQFQHSGVLPSAKDKRGGIFGLAYIPSHITRNGRDDRPEDGKPYPWLRVSLFEGYQDTVILSRAQTEKLRDALNDWLSWTAPSAPQGGIRE